ncbi:MAG: FecR domain-containing protein [Planctomycetota bacterium]|jgi:hypothetical protein
MTELNGIELTRDEIRAQDELLADAFSDHPFGGDLADVVLARLDAGGSGAARGSRASPSSGRILQGPGSWRYPWLPVVAAAAVLLCVVGLRFAFTNSGSPAEVPGEAIAQLVMPSSFGKASLARGGQLGNTVSVPVGGSLAVRVGDRVLVESGGAELRFKDGTRVRVRPDTQLQVTRVERTERHPEGGTQIAIAGGPGEVFCEVAPRKAGQVFQVSTPLGQTQVLGTRFSVRYEGEGSDRLAFATRGEQVVLSRAGRAPATQRVDLYRELSWAFGPAPEESPLAPEPGATSRPGTTPAAGARPSGAEPDAGADMPIGPRRDRPPAGPPEADPVRGGQASGGRRDGRCLPRARA